MFSQNLHLLKYIHKDVNFSLKKLAIFDLDGTISVFDEEKIDNFTFAFDGIKEKLVDLHKRDYLIVIITNQKLITLKKLHEKFKKKIIAMEKELEIPFYLCASLLDSRFRKPSLGMFYDLASQLAVSREKVEKSVYLNSNAISNDRDECSFSYTDKESVLGCFEDVFYVGDSAGRNNDYSDFDIKFAYNLNVPFFVPDEFFAGGIRYDKLNTFLPTNYSNGVFNFPVECLSGCKEIYVFLYGKFSSGKTFFVKKYNQYFSNCKVFYNCNDTTFINTILKNQDATVICFYFDHPPKVQFFLKQLKKLSEELLLQKQHPPFYNDKMLSCFKNPIKVPFIYDDSEYNNLKMEISHLQL
ncbi:hypothetical protein NUSPORA_01026 [Nucleospora cyclopteri]